LSSQYPHLFTLSGTAAEAHKAFTRGSLISPLGIEGLHQIGNSISTLRLYHRLGVRYATLTWNCHNAYADAAVILHEDGETRPSRPLWNGLSPAGRRLIYEMNRLGMLVDLSHVSADTMRDVLIGNPNTTTIDPFTGTHKPWTGSLAPPIFSHSSAHALCPHPRNVPDDVLQLVRRRNGLVMVNSAPDFISCRRPDNDSSSLMPIHINETNTLHQFVSHITYIGDRIGYEHVGLGSDFDGIPSTPRGFEDVSKYPDLVAELLRRGVTEEQAGLVVGRNLLRVWEEADRVAHQLQKEGARPLEDDMEENDKMLRRMGLEDMIPG